MKMKFRKTSHRVKQQQNQKGQAVLLVLLAVLVLFLLGTAALTIATASGRTAALQKDHIQVYYVAEAGAEYVLNRLIHEPAWIHTLPAGKSTVLSNFAYAGGSIKFCTVDKTVRGEVYELTITSAGIFGPAQKEVIVRAKFTPPHEEQEPSLTIDYWRERFPVF